MDDETGDYTNTVRAMQEKDIHETDIRIIKEHCSLNTKLTTLFYGVILSKGEAGSHTLDCNQ